MEYFYTRFSPVARSGIGARAFTLIEMLIVLAIIIIVTAIAIGGQSNFDRTLSLNNAAYDVALSLRQAQTYGLSSRVLGAGASSVRNTGYGIEFQVGTSYSMFADVYTTAATNATSAGIPLTPDVKPGNGSYDSSATSPSELIATYLLSNGFRVSDLCVYSSSATKCVSAGDTINRLDVVFNRPQAEAQIRINGVKGTVYQSACVVVSNSANSESRPIGISKSGQISIVDACAP